LGIIVHEEDGRLVVIPLVVIFGDHDAIVQASDISIELASAALQLIAEIVPAALIVEFDAEDLGLLSLGIPWHFVVGRCFEVGLRSLSCSRGVGIPSCYRRILDVARHRCDCVS
jgi:hypothetical protein